MTKIKSYMCATEKHDACFHATNGMCQCTCHTNEKQVTLQPISPKETDKREKIVL